MNWDHAVSWGRGVVWVSVSDNGRVDQPELVVGQPELKEKQKTSVLLFGLGGGSTKSPMCGK